jgi:glutathione S-transferase
VTDIILHHYPLSPFAEKIRTILGFKQLRWNSVIIPLIMPKPDLTALTGGYRRTPVLQIGADIYCDTALIADVLERIAPAPSLYPAPVAGMARILAQWADSTLFWTAITYAFQPAGRASLLCGMSPEEMKAFGADRAAMRGAMPRMAAAEATASLADYIWRLDNMLADGSPYLLGTQPTIADFSVYHPLWFVRKATALAGILDAAPKLSAWLDRMEAIGHHRFDSMDAGQALQAARFGAPSNCKDLPFSDTHGIALGERVIITPTDYALDPVEGELVAATANEFALRRSDERAGSVHVHFPRVGFQLKRPGIEERR